MVAGHCYIEQNGTWVLENLTSKDHIRGGLKAYRNACFLEIGGLKKSMGWDTIDELLALYNQWEFETDASLHVKHLKPTGANYNKRRQTLAGNCSVQNALRLCFGIFIRLKTSLQKTTYPSFLGLYHRIHQSIQSERTLFD